MKRLSNLTLAVLAAVGAVNLTDSTHPGGEIKLQDDSVGHGSLNSGPTGLNPSDLVVKDDGTIARSVQPSTPPVRVACDANCSDKCN
jgi:hypothetical protein